ncbi:hypothetical protein C2S52_008969 [Perilla frutescens var. hirtella]|nr:hypothetical protein C2S52_008969 [Perilla frutescens var. hirtella]
MQHQTSFEMGENLKREPCRCSIPPTTGRRLPPTNRCHRHCASRVIHKVWKLSNMHTCMH